MSNYNDCPGSVAFAKHIPPLKFSPLYHEKIWGGDRIQRFKGNPPTARNIGESWEISGVAGSETPVSGGPLGGARLSELLPKLGARLVGSGVFRRFGTEFPILVKFIDAAQDLSVQVHPDDDMARRYGYPNGKSEMWYVVDTDEHAHIICGFDRAVSPEEYAGAVAEGKLLPLLRDNAVQPGDCFYIPAGTVHSIGGGTFLIEIQQTSDLTYRIYDYDRRDAAGHLRELHTALAAEAIHFRSENECRVNYEQQSDEAAGLVDCSAFHVALAELTRPLRADYSSTDSFVIYVCFGGSAEIRDDHGCRASLRAGESLLIPAETQWVDMQPSSEGVKMIKAWM